MYNNRISPLPSFLRLVDFERSLNTVPAIRNFYVRDFQRGVATIEVHLVVPERWEALIEGLRKIAGLQVAAI
ncbi:MAG: hypothetical protein HYX89_02500 [Chloroflexi bacterium]|nr:hypothetical protein [Chloroflexota bacterium]